MTSYSPSSLGEEPENVAQNLCRCCAAGHISKQGLRDSTRIGVCRLGFAAENGPDYVGNSVGGEGLDERS